MIVDNSGREASSNEFARRFAKRAFELGASDRFAEALVTIECAIELDPDWAWAHALRGRMLFGLDFDEEALSAYGRAIELAPKWGEIHGFTCETLCRLDRFDEAIAACNRAIELGADGGWIHADRGNALRGLGRFKEAVAAWDRAIELGADWDWVHANRAGMLWQIAVTEGLAGLEVSRFQEVIAACDRAIELGADDRAWVHACRGFALFGLQRFGEALVGFDRAVELDAHWARANAVEKLQNAAREKIGLGESKNPNYTEDGRDERQTEAVPPPGIMPNAEYDLNELAAKLGLSFEEAAAKLMTPARKVREDVSSDPLSRARRVVRNFDNRLARNPDLPVPREVVDARSFVNHANYQNRKARTAKP